mmetsp:Transcript_22513/g.21633  ORF Transcript_22513/g.21633 Transcript_22513/m.21633 type:complete len:89 (-) Transcript_22513:13-279(-)
MFDEDPRKRCLHCIFTDNPGTKSSIGAVSPDLIALLLSKEYPEHNNANSITKKTMTTPRAIDVKIPRTGRIDVDITESIKIEVKSSDI